MNLEATQASNSQVCLGSAYTKSADCQEKVRLSYPVSIPTNLILIMKITFLIFV